MDRYTNAEGEKLEVRFFAEYTLNLITDIEIRDFSEIDVNGQRGYLMEAVDDVRQHMVVWQVAGGVIQVNSYLELEQLMRVAKGVSMK
jgi:hypothetical protein